MQEEPDVRAARLKDLLQSLAKEVCRHPERMGAELRRQHRDTTDFSQRHSSMHALDLLTEALNTQQFPELEKPLDGMFDSGVPQTLLDIALDPQIYAYMHVDAMATEYVLETYAGLSRLVCHAVKAQCGYAHAAERHPPWATELIQNFPKLWSLLLQHRELVSYGCDDLGKITLPADSGEADRSKRFRRLIYELLHAHKHLCEAVTGQLPSMRDDMGLIVLLVSTCASYAPDSRTLFLNIFFDTICKRTDDIIPFLDRAIACRALIPTRFIGNVRDCLLDEKLLDFDLLVVLYFSCVMCRQPALEAARGAEHRFSLALLFAAQRQVCSGIEEEYTWNILRWTFLQIVHILAQDPGAPGMCIATREFYNYLVLLAARSLCPAAMDTPDRINAHRWPPIIRILTHPAEILDDIMDILMTSAELAIEDPNFPPELNIAFRASVHQIWHRAHDGLAALSRAEAPQKWKVLTWWRNFGRKCGVDLDAPYVPPAPAAGGAAWKKDMGCAWRECLCFGERPEHSLRKCKRCERVLYCSRKCQTQDWSEGGHKRVCRQLQG